LSSGDVVRILFGGLLGSMAGSFANVCIHRIPRGESVVFPGSHCPGCSSAIRWVHNIPIVSFFILSGRCAHCHRSISRQYPLVEALSAFLFAVLARRNDPSLFLGFLGAVLILFLLIMSVIDFHLKIIPDVLSLGLLCLGLATAPLNPQLGFAAGDRALHGVTGAGVGFGAMWILAVGGKKVFKKEALGGGDIKLMAGLGCLLGPLSVFATVFLASLLGTLFFLVLKAVRRASWGAYLPFGPFLAAGALMYYFLPAPWLSLWGL